MAEAAGAERQSLRFLLLYALAAAGGSVAYVPFLTILLPLRITQLAGSADVTWLAYATFGGAVAASASNVLFGWASDVTRNRRGWVIAGLACSCLLLLVFPLVNSLPALVALIALWQVSLNLMLAPIGAWGGDCVPDAQKGLLGGLLALSPALGAIAGVVVTIPGLAGPDARLALVALLVLGCVLPVLLFGAPRSFPELMQDPVPEAGGNVAAPRPRGTVARMWVARLLVQLAEAALFAYLLFWLRGIDPTMTDSRTARIFGIVLGVAVPLALLVGRWADRHRRPILPLAVAAAVAALSLLQMARAVTLVDAVAGYVAFGLAVTVFLSLHSAQTLRVLPRAARRGRDLGLFNLTNTVPSLIMPWFTLALVPGFGFGGLFLLLAALSAGACLLLITMPRLT